MRGWGGAMAPSDVAGAGDYEWAGMTGMSPTHPLMGGGPRMSGIANPLDPDAGLGVIAATLPAGEAPGASDVDVFDDWRDLFDFRNSPAPWVLLLALAAIGFVQFRVQARGGPAHVNASLG